MARPAAMIACIAALFAAGAGQARDFGAHGPLFAIAETSILDLIAERLRAMEASGELAAMQEAMQTQVRRRVARPVPVPGIAAATEHRVYTVDLRVTVQRDLADHQGRVFARAGTVIDPLAHSAWNRRIVLIDGDVPEQVRFALAEGNELDTLIVLVAGAPLALTAAHGRRFWFDQQGAIAGRFGVTEVPAVITRADPLMQVEIVPVGGRQEEDGQ
jgi:conjugal transfer pilus assembly protein TraW